MIRRRKMRLYRGEFLDVLKSIFKLTVSKGRYIQEFERKFAQYIRVKHAIATCTGRNGMELILDSLKLEKGDEIILPAYTFKDLIYLIQVKGYVPVLVDINSDTFNLDPGKIQQAVTNHTKAIIATHIFGAPCIIDRILAIAEENNVPVIEDCAHAAGSEYRGQKAGSFGKAAFFSFERIKSINTFGGGMVTTNDDEVAQMIRNQIKSYPYTGGKIILKIFYTYFEHFILHSPIYILIAQLFKSQYFTKLISKVYLCIHSKSRVDRCRYSNLQALMGLRQLKEIDKRTSLRQQKAKQLVELLEGNIYPQDVLPDSKSAYYFFVIKTHFPFNEVKERMLRQGIDTSVGSEITDDCSLIINSSCPNARKVFNHAVQVPLYDDLKSEQIMHIAEAVNKLNTDN
ncbi:MAG: aminotransferase class I/II-fold pyridoxal phosphate-dependent enzyme [Candidatus Omnitrophica bacterium]|nr:aminotransferase class I/II-fold pyridoxal phosphate-dependent enzyme [Candidatus Omnitrophota bacterium]